MIKYILAGLLIVVALIYKFPIIKIIGDSMYPIFTNGETVIGKRISQTKALSIGLIYVYKHPLSFTEEKRYVVKRLMNIDEHGKLFFEGDNTDFSYDSRHYGYVKRDLVIATIKERRVRK